MALSALEALNRLRDAIADGGIETPEPGWKTIREWSAETGQSIANVGRILKEAKEKSMIEERTYRVRSGKMVRPMAHYRLLSVPVSVSRNKKAK